MQHVARVILVTLALVAAGGCAGPDEDANASTAAGASEDTGEFVGRAGDREFTLAEVDARASAANMQAYQALYDVRRAALDGLIEEHLLDVEAEKRGITPEDLVSQEVDQKHSQPTAADAEVFFHQNPDKMQGRTLKQMAPQIQA